MKIARLCAVITFIIAGLILFNWIFRTPSSGHLLPDSSTVKFNTALCLALSAISLYFLDQKKGNRIHKTLILGCTLAVLVIVLLTLCEYIFHFSAGIDQFFLQQATRVDGPAPGRMTVATAILLLLLCSVHLFLYRRRFHLVVQIILITGFALLVLVFLTSIAQATISDLSLFNASTLHTSFAFLLLYIGTFFSYPLSHLQFSFEKRMVANFSFAILLLTIVFFSFKTTSRRFVETSNLINQTHEVLLKAKHVGSETTEMQSGLRGYYLTGDESFLASFHKGAAAVGRHIAELKALTKSSTGQQQRIDSLQNLVDRYIQSRKEIIHLSMRSALDTAALRIATIEGRSITTQISTLVDSIQEQENQLLARQKAEKEESIHHSSKAVALFQVVTVLLLILAFAVVYRNARQRKKAEDQIRQLNEELEKRVEEKTKEAVEKEKQYRFLVENMQEGVQVIGFDWRYQLVNNAFIRQREHAGELIGHSFLEKNPGIETTKLYTVLQQCMRERTAARMEHANNKGCFELSIEPVPEGLFILSMDITERKKYLDELKQSQVELAKAQKIARLSKWEWNVKTGIENPAPDMLELIGWLPGPSFSTAEFLNLIDQEDRGQFEKEMQVALENGTNLNCEFRINPPGGQKKYFHITGEIYSSPEAQGFKGTIQDVTELKRSEAMLKQLNVNLEKRALELRASNTELERFAFVASHDLQEPLRMVSSFLSLLETETEGQLDEAAKEYIHYAVDGAERMKKLIQALLEYSRLGVSNENRTDVDCNEVVWEVRNLLDLNIRESGAILQVQSLPTVRAVESQLQQLFQNLISNALKYKGNRQPQIEVGCIEEAAQWKFYVKDNGIGIDPKYFEKIFIIFQRLHDKREYSGTGIGLAICKKIVEKHGGTIWVESQSSQGTTFFFTIPK
jgi:two-component system CheB/CheR fusion protein